MKFVDGLRARPIVEVHVENKKVWFVYKGADGEFVTSEEYGAMHRVKVKY
jgi:hypothetical protein